MIRRVLILSLAAVAFCLAGCSSSQENAEKKSTVQSAAGEQPGQTEKLLRHVVLFKFKEGTTVEQKKTLENEFRALADKIDAVKDFECGTDISVENLDQGFTHCFQVSFADEAGRDRYLPHPAHKAFVETVSPHLEKVLVVDYWAGK